MLFEICLLANASKVCFAVFSGWVATGDPVTCPEKDCNTSPMQEFVSAFKFFSNQFLSDPGTPEVRSMGPDVQMSVCLYVSFLLREAGLTSLTCINTVLSQNIKIYSREGKGAQKKRKSVVFCL